MSSVTATLLSQRTHRVPGKLQITEYFFRVPLDYSQPTGSETLRLFARGIVKAKAATAPEPAAPLPWLTYFQGGPGFGCRAPGAGGWVGAALDAGYRVLLLDQRGTGLSQPVTPGVLAAVGRASGGTLASDDGDRSIAAQAAYLRHFRAPGIVQDAEAVRRALAEAEGAPADRKWSVMGQSFGGFCVVHYLSHYPAALAEAFTCGGLPPLTGHPDAVYSRLVQRWIRRTAEYYAKFPEDVSRVKDIAKYLETNEIKTPSGGRLSVQRLRGIGMDLGFHGGFTRMHNLVMRMAADLEYDGALSEPTLDEFEHTGAGFDQAILYALLHEPCYLQGEAANWAAERAITGTPQYQSEAEPFHFTAEAITRSVFTDYPGLQPLQRLGEHLAADVDWAPLYDRKQLARNTVPLYAATYMDDQYVDFELAQATAASIANCKLWITNAAYHDAIRGKADEVMRNLIGMRDDVID